MRWAAAAALTLGGLAACTVDGPSVDAPTSPPGTPLFVEAAPLLTIGAIGGDTLQELDEVTTPFIDGAGRVVVPLGSAHTIRVFGPDGSFVESLGGPGEGPGEFRSLSGAWARGDTIEALDGRLRRVTRFLPDGTVEVVTLEGTIRTDVGVPGAAPDGWVVLELALGQASPDGSTSPRDVILVHRFARDGTHLRQVAQTEGMARFRGEGFSGPEPASPRTVLSLRNGRLYVGETLTPVIRVFAPDGTLERELAWDAEAAPQVTETVGAIIDSAAALVPPEQAEGRREQLGSIPLPERLSTWWEYIVDSEGFVWVRPYEPLRHAAALGGLSAPGGYVLAGRGGGGRWLILSPDGERIGEVDVPEGLRPVHIEGDRLLALRTDELGVEYVQVHRVVRR